MAKNQELLDALLEITYTGTAADDDDNIAMLKRLVAEPMGDSHEFRVRVLDEAGVLNLPAAAPAELHPARHRFAGRPTVQYLLDNGGGDANLTVDRLISIAKMQLALIEVSKAIADEDNIDDLAVFIADLDRDEIRGAVGGLSDNAGDLFDEDVDAIIATIQARIVAKQIEAIDALGLAALDLLAPAVDVDDNALRGVLGGSFTNLTDPQTQEIRDAAKAKISALQTDAKLLQIAAVDIAHIARDLDVLQPAVVGAAAPLDDTNLKAQLDAGYEHISPADLIRIRTAAREKIATLRFDAKIIEINGRGFGDVAALTVTDSAVGDAGMKAHLGADFDYLSHAQLDDIRLAAHNKIAGFAALTPRQQAILKATPFANEARAIADRAAAQLALAQATVNQDLAGGTHAEFLLAEAALLAQALAADTDPVKAAAVVKKTEVETAHRLAVEAVEKAVEASGLAEKAAVDAAAALALASDAGTSDADALTAATQVETHKNSAQKSERHVNEVKTSCDRYLLAAQHPEVPANKLARANIFIERFGQLGYTDKIVRSGEAAPGADPDDADGVLQQLGHGGLAPEYDGALLNKGDTIHSVQEFDSGAVSRLVQDHTGKVFTKSDLTNATPVELETDAIKQAKMLLTNYNPVKGPIYIAKKIPPEHAKRILAAILLLSENADMGIEPTDIRIKIIGWDVKDGKEGLGWRTKNMFINNQLSNVRNSVVIDDEKQDVISQQRHIKATVTSARHAAAGPMKKEVGEEFAVGYKAPGRPV